MKKPILIILALCSLFSHLFAQTISTVAGNGSLGYWSASGLADTTTLNTPYELATDRYGNVYFSDYENNIVRKIATDGRISTIAGVYGLSGYNSDGIPATAAYLSLPIGVAVDSLGNIYIADNGNFRVREINATTGIISTVAGVGGISGYGYSGDGGPATAAHLYAFGVAVDKYQNLYIADGNTAVRKVDPSSHIITTIAGSTLVGFSGDEGLATAAAMNNPTGLAVDSNANVFIADYNNNRVRVVIHDSIVIFTFAGNDSAGFSGDGGPCIASYLNHPYSVGADNYGNVYIADFGNNRIRMVDTSYNITTIAGGGSTLGDWGPATAAMLSDPTGVCVDGDGNIYIADQGNERIRKISGHRNITACVGSSTYLEFNIPGGHFINPAPSLVAIDSASRRITGLDTGSVIITYIVGIDTVTASVTLTGALSAGTIAGADTLCVGDTVTLSDSVAGGIWSSSDTNAAALSSAGVLVALHAGIDTVDYTVSAEGCSLSASRIIDLDTSGRCNLAVPAVIVAASSVVVYPDPSYGSFTVSLGNGQRSATITLYDMYGRELVQKVATTADTEFNILGLAPGVYALSIEQGGGIQTRRIVIR